MKFALIFIISMLMHGPAAARDIALADSADYHHLAALGWTVSSPRFSPDSSQVIFDKPGNVDFSTDEKALLDSLGVQRIPESSIREWLDQNAWNGEGE